MKLFLAGLDYELMRKKRFPQKHSKIKKYSKVGGHFQRQH